MKSRLLWLAVVLAAMGGFYYTTIRPAIAPAPTGLNRRLSRELRPPEIPLPSLPEPKVEMPTLPLPPPELFRAPPAAVANTPRDDRTPLRQVVPIQDGATIDFSIGGPVVRSAGDDQAALEKALKEMADATKDVAFPAAAAKK